MVVIITNPIENTVINKFFVLGFLQQGIRLFNHYGNSHVDNVGECINKCKSDDQCVAITHTRDKDWAQNCYLYKDGYGSAYDPTLKFSTWTKNEIELGTRLFNHYDASSVHDPSQCKDRCATDSKCKAMTFDSGNTYSSGNCFLFQTYRMQVDDKMKWSSWRKRN